jgi:hypothetical protein
MTDALDLQTTIARLAAESYEALRRYCALGKKPDAFSAGTPEWRKAIYAARAADDAVVEIRLRATEAFAEFLGGQQAKSGFSPGELGNRRDVSWAESPFVDHQDFIRRCAPFSPPLAIVSQPYAAAVQGENYAVIREARNETAKVIARRLALDSWYDPTACVFLIANAASPVWEKIAPLLIAERQPVEGHA